MIVRGSMKADAFLRRIASTIAGREVDVHHSHVITQEAFDETVNDGVYYFAGGYWRGRPVWNADGLLDGVELVNPDRTFHECKTVEAGIAILLHLSYR